MNLKELAVKKQRIASIAKWSLAAIAALLVAPVIFMVVTGAVGLISAAVVGLAVVNFAPAVSMKFANWKLKAIKAEANRNPIETLQNVFHVRMADKAAFKILITAFRTEVSGFADKVEVFKAQFPKDADKFARQLEGMNMLLARREAKYKHVKAELEQFEAEIQRADAIWQMSLAAQALNAAAGMESEDVYAKIKTETAIESVQHSLNKAFAEMQTELMDNPSEYAPPSLSPPDVDTTTVVDINVRQKEYAR